MNTNTQHTAGPWDLWLEGSRNSKDYTVEGVGRFEMTGENAHANARLIAAAPDLLEALQAVLPDLEHYVSTHGAGPDKRLLQAQQTIAKATK